VRLQQYKNSKSKRLDELEGKVRQMEVMENIDLNKLLDELRMRDKKLKQLKNMEYNVGARINVIQKLNEKKVGTVHKKYEVERELKNEAFEKLDALRLEIRALEGKDHTSDMWKEK
jgi:hypothetical protein